MRRLLARRIWMATVVLVLAPPIVLATGSPTTGAYYDVILLMDASPEMAALGRKSAMVVVEAMGDRHRLGITTFGRTATVVRPLDRVATVGEKMAALQALNDAPFQDEVVDLGVGLTHAMASLDEKGAKSAERIIVLLTGAPSLPDNDAALQSFKTTLPPKLLADKIKLYVVATKDANIPLLQQTANLTEGKLLAAFDVETMTDALDMVVEKLSPPKQVVVTKEVPVKTQVIHAATLSPDEKLRQNEAASRRWMLLGFVGAALLAMLASLLILQVLLMRRLSARQGGERKESGDARKEKSSFAKLRDLANVLNNTVVDAGEMVGQLNLDLEDFGVEKWRREKALGQKLGELSGGIFLILDHLSVEGSDRGNGDWGRKLQQLLDDAGIEEMTVSPGDAFDGLYHKHVAEADSEIEKGCVVEVKRPGYQMADPEKTSEIVVLRQAEVAVSRGPKSSSKA